MDKNEKKKNAEPQTDEAPKTDEAKETSKTDVNEQPKKETTVSTAKVYSFIALLVVVAINILIVIVPKISDAIEDYKIHEEVANEDEDYDTNTYTSSSSDYDTDEDYDTSSSYSSDDDTSSSFSDDYSALDYESQNCYDTAMSYLDFMAFSKNGLIHQLQHDGYTNTAISNALDLLEKDYVSWDIEAVKKAQEYMETFSFSQQRLYEQLVHDGFTEEQANYGASYVYNNN